MGIILNEEEIKELVQGIPNNNEIKTFKAGYKKALKDIARAIKDGYQLDHKQVKNLLNKIRL